MRIAVVNETSAGDKNPYIIEALQGYGHTVINAGMQKSGGSPELTYIETGFISALLLNAGRADFIVGGCGTGQGFLNSALQYPGVFCGLITKPLDAWLFSRINNGNCISLALNQGYGWAGEINLKFIFEKLFAGEAGEGFPESRRTSQQASRERLVQISALTHRPFAEIVRGLNPEIPRRAISFPGIEEILDIATLDDLELKSALQNCRPIAG
ncbi:MAG TPA: ribose-5-phosphate isomerase [Clostridiales bacterium]|nr:ribose-5-phosphate isomerase [Clostridiales bacterium]